MRLHLMVLILLVGTSPLWASLIGIQWPGWEIRTTEKSSLLKYPLTNMLDGKPETACVLNKWGYSGPTTNANNNINESIHGVGTAITVKTGEGITVVCDGIGIINGYAKNNTIYKQNNRITKITLNCKGPKTNWWKSYSLKETTEIQNLSIPHLRLNQIKVSFDEVNVGKDDDLCVSELVLYRDKKPIPWKLTPTVICNRELGCDASPSYILLSSNKNYGDSIEIKDVFPQPNNPNRVILFAPSNQLILFDFKLNKYVWRKHFYGLAENFGWKTNTRAYLRAYNWDDEKQTDWWEDWYMLNTVDFSWKKIKALPKKSRGFMRPVNMGC